MKLGTSAALPVPDGAGHPRAFQQPARVDADGRVHRAADGRVRAAEQARNLMEVAAAARAAGLDACSDRRQPRGPAGLRRDVLADAHRRAADERDRRHADRRGPARAVLPPDPAGRADRHARRVRRGAADRDLRAGRPPAAVRGVRHGGAEPRRAASRRWSRSCAPLLAGERVTHRGRYFTLDGATISPLPRVPVEIWIGGTVPAGRARRADGRRLADGPERDGRGSRRAARPVPRGGDARRAGRRARSCAATSTSASPTTRRARSSARSSPRAIAAPAWTSCSSAARTTVVEKLRDYRELGFDSVMVRHIVGDHALMLRSFERIGAKVIPALRGVERL